MEAQEILDHLAKEQAVLTGQHFVYTSGKHGPAYVNIRAVAHQPHFLEQVADSLARQLKYMSVDVLVGPETLGRSLASYAALHSGLDAVWCDIVEYEDGSKEAVFSPKLNFARLLPGKRVAIVDDLLTSGLSIRLTAEAVHKAGGIVVAAAVVVRRTPEVDAAACDVPELFVLAEVEGFELFTEQECNESGPCSRQVPMVLRPGHGFKWVESHPDYPVAK